MSNSNDGNAVFAVALTEWCSDRSVDDKRVELLGAFFREESAAGRVRDVATAFAAAFAAFATRAA